MVTNTHTKHQILIRKARSPARTCIYTQGSRTRMLSTHVLSDIHTGDMTSMSHNDTEGCRHCQDTCIFNGAHTHSVINTSTRVTNKSTQIHTATLTS